MFFLRQHQLTRSRRVTLAGSFFVGAGDLLMHTVELQVVLGNVSLLNRFDPPALVAIKSSVTTVTRLQQRSKRISISQHTHSSTVADGEKLLHCNKSAPPIQKVISHI